MCCGRVGGGFPQLSASPAAVLHRFGVEFSLWSLQWSRRSDRAGVHMVVPVPSAGQERVPDGAVSPLPLAPSPSHSSSQTPHLHNFSRKPLPALSQLLLSLGSHPSSPSPCPLSPRSPAAPALGSSAAAEAAASQDPVTAKSISVQPHTALRARLHLPALVLHRGWQRHVSSVCPFPSLCPPQPACTGWTFGSKVSTKLWK